MFNVYWMECENTKSKLFDTHEMSAALKFMEGLRKRKYEGENVGFVCMASENPNCVGKLGVDEPSPDYDWKKRR